MKRVFTTLGWIVAAIWSIFVLVASNGPAEVQTRTDDWLSLPIIDKLPLMALDIVGSAWVIAISFLGLGVAVGLKFANRRKAVRVNSWWISLAHEMQWLAIQID